MPKFAFVWADTTNLYNVPAPGGMGTTVALWTSVLGEAAYNWQGNNIPDLSRYDVIMVNLLGDPASQHLAQLRRAYPDKMLIAMPDPSLDLMLYRYDWLPLWEQLTYATHIGARTEHGVEIYSTLLNKPAFWLPSPVGPMEQLAAYRDTPKQEYILALDHPIQPYSGGQNVAALAAIQRQTGLKVRFYNAKQPTVRFAELAGLDVDYYPAVPMSAFCQVIAEARLSVDLYNRHTFHRHAVLCAALGTPCINPFQTTDIGHPMTSVFAPQDAAARAVDWLDNPDVYERIRQRGFDHVQMFDFASSRQRLERAVQQSMAVSPNPGYMVRPYPDYCAKTGGGEEWQGAVYDLAHDVWDDALPVVDLGCGSGDKLLSRFDGSNLIGVDYGANIQYCRNKHGDRAKWVECDFDHWPGISLRSARGYPALFICADVIEHLRHPDWLLSELRAHLAIHPGSVLVISTPDRDMWRSEGHNGPPPNQRHTREWNANEFKSFLESFDFVIDQYSHVQSRDSDSKAGTLVAVITGVHDDRPAD